MIKIKNLVLAVSLISSSAFTGETKFISIGKDALHSTQKQHLLGTIFKTDSDDAAVVEIDERDIEKLSHHMHEEFHRCGGYIVHDDLEEAMSYVRDEDSKYWGAKGNFADYSIDQQDTVNEIIGSVTESKINNVITKLSSFHNRYYNAIYGVESSTWIKDH